MNQIEKISYMKKIFKNIENISNSTFVIQCGGNVLENNNLLNAFAEDVVFMQKSGVNIIIIADGQNIADEITATFNKQRNNELDLAVNISSVELMEMILVGYVNQKIVHAINIAGGSAQSLSGKDAQFMLAKRSKVACFDPYSDEKILNIGFLGELSMVSPDILLIMEENNFISVISPIALGDDGRTYKLDASDVAIAISAVMSANHLAFLTDETGIKDNDGQVINKISIDAMPSFAHNAKNQSNLIKAASLAIEQGIEHVMILDGKVEHSLLLAAFDENIAGTRINW